MKTFDGYKKRNLTDKDYALLAGGGHKALDTLFSALSSDTTNAIKITVGGTEKSITTDTLKTSLGLGSNAYTSTAYLPLAGGTLTGTLTISTTGTGSYNQGIRINRTATNQWATLLIGKSGTATTGTGTETVGDGAWLIGTPASSNSLVFNLNRANESVGLCLKGHGNTDMKWNNNTVWHAGNDGSGSGLDADLLDGIHANGLFTAFSNAGSQTTRITIGGVTKDLKVDADLLDGQHGSRYTRTLGGPNYITINVGGNANTYYPVVISDVSDFYPMQFVNISRTYYETAPDTWNTSTHKGGLTLTLLWNGSRYWDGNSSGAACYCVYKNESYSTMVGGLGNAVGGKVVWLRGGGAVYHIHSMNGTSTSVTVYTSTYTDSAKQSFAPKTTPEVISVRWPGYTQGADYATSAGNADTVDGLHYSSFLRKDTNDSTPYQYTFTKTNDHAIRVGTVRGTAVGSQTGEYIHLYERVAIGSPSGWGSRSAPSYGLATYGGAWLATDTGNVTIGGTNQLSSSWGSFNLTVGNNTNKVVIGYLNSSTNGVVVGGHNNALSAWAPLNIAGTTLYFRINETIKATLDSNGNVGIGTTSPSQKLHVNGSVYLGKTDLDNTPFTDSLQILANSSNESYNENFNESNQSFGITFVRDWASRGYRTKQGGIYSVGSGNWRAGLAFRVKNNTTANGTHDITAMWISPIGNVGIGTTSPSYKLHVNGTFGVTDITTFNINNQWLTPSVLQIGRLDASKNSSKAVIGVTDGNLHIDAYHGKQLYLNYYNKGQIRLGYQSGSYYISEDGSYYNGTATKAEYPVGFTSRQTSDWSGVPGTFVTAWHVNNAEIMFKYNGSNLNVITDGRFYQGIDIYGTSKRVLDEYDISNTTWGNADTVDNYHATSLSRNIYIGWTADFCYDVILLWPRDSVNTHRIDGYFYTTGNGVCRYHCAEIHSWFSCWSIGSYEEALFINNVNNTDSCVFRLCTCNYNGKVWYCIRLNRIQAVGYLFQGTWSNIDFTLITYYHTSQGIKNSEIYNSLSEKACQSSIFYGNITAPNFYSSSDIRLKNNINNISKSIRSFNWKESGQKSYGLIAQEIENEYPELVSSNDNGYKSINYTSALCMIIAKLENEVDKLKERIEQLEQSSN